MSTPYYPPVQQQQPAPPATLQGQVMQPVQPTAIAGPKPAHTHKLGNILVELIHHSTAFKSENDRIDAENVVRGWVGTQVTNSDRQALDTENDRAQIEDVSLRVAPHTSYAVPNTAGAPIDYDKLARAIVRAQQAEAVQDVVPQ